MREHIEPPWLRKRRDPGKWDALARFNSERSRGILHSQEWIDKMAAEQKLFDVELAKGQILITRKRNVGY